MKFKILLTSTSFQDTPGIHQDALDKTGWDIIRKRGPLKENTLLQLIDKVDAVICGDDEYTAQVIKKGAENRLKVISKYGVGLDSIDLSAAQKNNVAVTNCPAVNQNGVAEHVLGLLLSFARNIHHQHISVQDSSWKRLSGFELKGRKIGILGYGAVGKEVALKAHLLGLEVFICDPFIDPKSIDKEYINVINDLTALLAKVDILSIHVPLKEDTEGIISREVIKKAKPGLLIVNTSRGKLVDNRAILEGIENKELSGYLADVLDEEPIVPNHPFLNNPNILITPHIASRTKESVQKQGKMAVENTIRALAEI